MKMLSELLKSVLLIVVAFLLQMALAALGVELDEGTFVAIVAAIVAYILSLLGLEGARSVFPNKFK
jgi:hypothetical protein